MLKRVVLILSLTTRIQIPVDSPGFYRISVAVQSKQTKEPAAPTASPK